MGHLLAGYSAWGLLREGLRPLFELLLAKASKALSSLELEALFAFDRTERGPKARPRVQCGLGRRPKSEADEGSRPNKGLSDTNLLNLGSETTENGV